MTGVCFFILTIAHHCFISCQSSQFITLRSHTLTWFKNEATLNRMLTQRHYKVVKLSRTVIEPPSTVSHPRKHRVSWSCRVLNLYFRWASGHLGSSTVAAQRQDISRPSTDEQ